MSLLRYDSDLIKILSNQHSQPNEADSGADSPLNEGEGAQVTAVLGSIVSILTCDLI